MLPFDHFNLIDTPGLNDPNMTTAEWGTKLNEWSESQTDAQRRIGLTCLIFKQCPRPDTADVNCLAVLKNALSRLNAKNLCVIFTFCDEINPNKRLKKGERRFDKDYAQEWFNEHVRKDHEGNLFEGIPEIGQDRIFFFKGEEGMSGPETTTEELVEFVRYCMPQPQQAATIKHFDYSSYMETAKNSCNKDLQNIANAEIEEL